MGQKLVIGPIDKGLRTDRLAFNIDNDSFPNLVNAYQWRGRVKRKRGTIPLGRLTRQISSDTFGITNGSGLFFGNILSAVGLAGIITGVTQANPGQVTSLNHNLVDGNTILISGVVGMTELNNQTYSIIRIDADNFTIGVDTTLFTPYISGGSWKNTQQPNASVALGSVVITVAGTPNQVFMESTPADGTLNNGGVGTGTIDYVTGIITLITDPILATAVISVVFSYYPGLPVMGIEDLALNLNDFPGTIAFDTTYSYNISTASPYPITDINFYRNPPTGINPGYVEKPTDTPFTWNGKNYQQFWTCNYQSALWASNGVQVPFQRVGSGLGMQLAAATADITTNVITSATYASATTMTFVITNCPLVVGDFVFANEFQIPVIPPLTSPYINGLNFQTGYVTSSTPNTPAPGSTTVIVTFPKTVLTNVAYIPGLLQYLTNTSTPTIDCLRFYDGTGWVNFMPPLSQGVYSISDENSAQYYLVGAKIIYPFKDRLIFFGPVIQTSTGNPIYLPDTAIYSWNGTPYYTASFTKGSAFLFNATNIIPILAPEDETAFPTAYFEDQVGFGGFAGAFLSQSIATVSPNADALIVGFNNSTQARFLYTGNDLLPFQFYVVNSELGSSSTFSIVNMDEGVITRGPKGFIISSQTGAKRIDLDILDQPFDISNTNNGTERFCAQRDFNNEWIYFTYSNGSFTSKYNNQTLQYNYRDDSWAIFNESYTTYGSFRYQTGFTWETLTYAAWNNINATWESFSSQLLEPVVIAGNQQGFIVQRGQGTEEAPSLYIQSIGGGFGNTITCPDHCLDSDDFIFITGVLGTIAPYLNNQVFQISVLTSDTFNLVDFFGAGTYLGGGVITRFYVPYIQTKQFPIAWSDSRKVRFGVQQYLLTMTSNAQITLLMFLSQDSANSYNNGDIYPGPNVQNSSLLYSTILYTCPESTNLGLTPANVNLQMPTALNQQQIWHRINTSLIGDTVQIGFTLSDAQMLSYSPGGALLNITGATQANPCVLTCSNAIAIGSIVRINGVRGMTQLNGNIFYVLNVNATTVTINVNSTIFDPYISAGTLVNVFPFNQVAEVELHGIILDVNPSQLLS